MKPSQLNPKIFNMVEQWAIGVFFIQFFDKKDIYQTLDEYTHDQIVDYEIDLEKAEPAIFNGYERIKTDYFRKVIRRFYDYHIAVNVRTEGFERMYSYYMADNAKKLLYVSKESEKSVLFTL